MAVTVAAVFAGAASAAHAALLAQANGRGVAVDWNVLVDYQKAVLTVSMPDGTVSRAEFKAGVTPTFSAFDKKGEALPAGAYRWELRLTPNVSADVAAKLAEARARGDERAAKRIQRANGLTQELVQSGAFQLRDGGFDVGGAVEHEPARATEKKLGAVTGADQVIPDDLIVQGSECVGFDCVNNESFGFDTIRLKENNTRIKFDDTSVGSFPANDWQLTANDSASGGSSRFSIEDITGSKVPFTITAGASTNSIFVDSTGRVGLRTSTPVLDLHIATSNTPAIRLEQNNSGGFTAQTWDIGANEANFFVRDVTGGSKLSFRIRPGAPTSSLDIASDGDVGVGTGSPADKLDVVGGNVHVDAATTTTDAAVAVGPDIATGTTTFNFGYGGASFGVGSAFLNSKATGATAPNPSIRFLVNTTERMIIDNEGFIGLGVANPTAPIHHSSGAMLTATGQWQPASSRALKQDIKPLATTDAMAALAGLAPVRYHYKVDPENDEYVGYIAEDVPELVATVSRKTLSPVDIVAVLTKVVQEQQRQIQELSTKVEQLQQAQPK
jgi:hypothetical protein